VIIVRIAEEEMRRAVEGDDDSDDGLAVTRARRERSSSAGINATGMPTPAEAKNRKMKASAATTANKATGSLLRMLHLQDSDVDGLPYVDQPLNAMHTFVSSACST
jgi:hypothetical protein